MDPISIIITALITGASAGLKPTAEKAVKDAYEGVKTFIQDKYRRVNIDMLEADPASEARQSVVKEDLAKADVSGDEELLRRAKAMLEAIRQHAPEAAAAAGVDLEEIKGASLQIDDILSAGAGVKIKKAEISGDIKISGVRAGGGDDPSRPSKRH